MGDCQNMLNKIYLAGGCFWGVAEYYRRLKGVESTVVGYAQGHTANPTYREVCTQTTNHTETVEVIYDDSIISLEKIIEHFFRMIDPTVLNRQGNDVGTQYRTGIYSLTTEENDLIKEIVKGYQPHYNKEIVVEVEVLKNFYLAETEHQDYLVKNPYGYCHINFSLIKKEELK